MEKKRNRGLMIVTVILFICVIGLIIYILMDKNVIKLNNNTVENEQVEENNTNEDEYNRQGIAISVDNENIITLFNNAHHLTIGPETYI